MQDILVEGYAALFGAADLEGDVVIAGAFRDSLRRRAKPLPMLVQHEQRLLAGVWDDIREDARGLYVRGRIAAAAPGAARARRLLAAGADGLSIGFVTLASEKLARGRALLEIELLEISIVMEPMQPLARLNFARGLSRAA